MSQNLISAELPTNDVEQINAELASINAKLGFMLSIAPEDVSTIFKPGKAFLPLIEIAKETMDQHPEIMPRLFQLDEFYKDYNLSNSLTPIESQVKQLAEALEKTKMAVGSDLIKATLDIYEAVKQNKDQVPGLDVIAKKMAEFFKKTRPRKDESEELDN